MANAVQVTGRNKDLRPLEYVRAGRTNKNRAGIPTSSVISVSTCWFRLTLIILESFYINCLARHPTIHECPVHPVLELQLQLRNCWNSN